jgi:disulfide bond formation protein DsbB
MTLFGLMAVGLWVGMWLLLERRRWRQLWPGAVKAVVAPTVVTLGLIMPLLLPGLELARLSERSAWHYVQSVGFSLSPAQLIGLLIPGFFGRGPALHWGMWPRVEVGYVGVITLVLALVAVFVRRERLTWQMLGVALVALAFSLGIYSILHGWLTWLLPGLEQLRAPARFIFLFDLAVALLAGQGLQTLLGVWNDTMRTDFDALWRWLRALLLIGVAVGAPVIYAVLLLTQSADPTLHLRASVSTIAVVDFLLLFGLSLLLLGSRRRQWLGRDLFGVLVLALLLLDLASLGAYEDLGDKDPTANFQHPAIITFLQADPDLFRIDTRTDIEQMWQPDTALVYGLDDVWGVVNPLTLTYYADYLEATGGRSSDLYALTNVKYVIARKDVVLDWDNWELALADDPDLNVYRFRRFTPRVLLLGKTRAVDSLAAAQALRGQADFAPLAEVIVEGDEALAGVDGRAEVMAWDLNQVRVQTSSVARGALLVAQSWYPGWQAQVDGGDWQPVLRADGAWQAVIVPAGEHTVVLRFRPLSFFLGLGLAALTLLVTAWRVSRVRV